MNVAGEETMHRVIMSSTELPEELRHRRSARRLPSTVQVEVLGPRKGTGVVMNASSGGMRIAVDCELARGEVCSVRLVGGTGVALFDSLRVVWAHKLADGWVAGLARIRVD